MSAGPEGLLIGFRDAPDELIPWQDLARAQHVHTGAAFHRLALEGKPALRWIGRWHRHFWRAFSQYLHQQHEPDFAVQLQRIETAVRQGYVRSSTWSQLQAQAAALLQHRDAALVQAPARPDLRYQRLGRIASGDPQLLQRYREHYLSRQQTRHRTLFDQIERLPLTPSQQRACITLDDNNLVLAGAGSGKTSTLIGRAAYLIASDQAEPQDILLLAFGRQAADEMQQRLQQRLGIKLDATTFHALGQRIITAVEGRRPRISPFAEDDAKLGSWVASQFEALLETPEYRRELIAYLLRFRFPADSPFDFATQNEHQRFVRSNGVCTLSDSVDDAAGEEIQSSAAGVIADWLWSQGINYRYRPAGIYSLAPPQTPATAQGTIQPMLLVPDFYLPAQDICIDLLLLDRDEDSPAWIEPAAYQRALDALRHADTANGQRRIELQFHQQQDGSLIDDLARQLSERGVVAQPKTDPQILARLQDGAQLQPLCDLLTQMLRSYRTLQPDAVELRARIDASPGSQQLEQALRLLQPLHSAYRAELAAHDEIDFDDMIAKALEYVEQGRFASPWQHILVDEFQDISALRARLIRALRDAVPGAALFAVGDDWQSIYRFTGSDVGLTTDFAGFFGPASISALDQTFRFNSSIGELASRFVLRNPAQLPKQLHSQTQVETPAVSLLAHRSREPAKDAGVLERALEVISQRFAAAGGASCTVMIMARNRFSLPDSARLAFLQRRFGQLQLQSRTLHAAKGREADYAIILGLESGKYGFPAERRLHPVQDALLPGGETYPHAEERRLFYVALTRARHRVYLVYNSTRPSCFVTELIADQYPIEQHEFEPAH
ncbi:UvrD-helicase domain-containing protein [Marinobacterium aestuarii]|uniref:UvrD-helicase domain-containing protein n=1 Tax=Marinobacterium aestuarii TaxID=1821621 RepID=UPI00138FFFAD|nr:UvrD-helicase domain-containing protein [Marinobacterium aestuarii]